ncbi:hypothetical protein [Virgibacillus siamensis]|uniref:hypothetical protein n=1 Tax=Virgibacillus siamensis TaxID=480071 RepID=UPI000984D8F0|nr:hypothetical protein [Virgibacillus siamensis]
MYLKIRHFYFVIESVLAQVLTDLAQIFTVLAQVATDSAQMFTVLAQVANESVEAVTITNWLNSHLTPFLLVFALFLTACVQCCMFIHNPDYFYGNI